MDKLNTLAAVKIPKVDIPLTDELKESLSLMSLQGKIATDCVKNSGDSLLITLDTLKKIYDGQFEIIKKLINKQQE